MRISRQLEQRGPKPRFKAKLLTGTQTGGIVLRQNTRIKSWNSSVKAEGEGVV